MKGKYQISSKNFILIEASSFLRTLIRKAKGTYWDKIPVSLEVSKYVQEYSFVRGLPTYRLWCFNSKLCQCYSKNCILVFMQDMLRHNYSIFELSLWIEKFGEKEEELQRIEYLEKEKSFPGEMKSIFHIFLRTSCNIKNSKKIPAKCPRRNLL